MLMIIMLISAGATTASTGGLRDQAQGRVVRAVITFPDP